ncbi:MAG TPA: PEGA domain-containing protein [Anaeromyxobacter sp.]
MRLLALATTVLLLPAAARPDAKPRLAVLDLAANGASRELAAAAGTAVATELDRLRAFQVITSEAIRSMLAYEKQRQMLGCAEAGCMAEIGGALGADWLVSGKVTRLAAAGGVPETLSLDLTLTAVRTGQREGSVIETARSEPELVQRAARAAQKLVQKVLAGRAGRLVVTASETGAVIRVDDQARGTTPLRGPIVVAAGPHALAVEKRGFVVAQKDVQVEAGKVLQEEVALVPSPDFVRAWESRQRKLRAGAWLSTGAAVAGLAGAVALQASASQLYGNESTPGTFLYDRARVQAGALTENGVDLRAEASSLQSTIRARETWSYVSLGVGAVAAVAATYFWIAGEDPNRYAGFAEPVARVEVVPLQGGALASVALGF